MKLLPSIRGGLLLTSACAVLAACSGGGNNANNGNTGPVTIGGGGGGGGGGNAADQSFVPAGFTCPNGSTQGTITSGTTTIEACVIAGDITSNVTLPGTFNGERVGYMLDGSVFVGDNLISNPSGSSAVLEIGAGAILMGQNGEDALFINPGSRLNALGTQGNPIVMTSATDAADGNVDDGLVGGSSTEKGEWGGLVINGLAPINDCDVSTNTPGAADCNKTGEGGSGLFGGTNPNDNSGRLEYVRVQYAGFRFNGEDELNGIAFQGVGDMTVVDHIHVHNGNDDGVEFFGGTVDATHVVVTGADDDSIDWTDGWQGDLQFAVVVQDDVSADRGIEGDNRGNDINVGEAEGLRSMPNISNFTFLGSSAAAASPTDGIKIRAGTDGVLANGIVVGFGLGDGLDYDDDVDYDDDDVADETSTATPEVFSLFVSGNNNPFDGDGGTLFNVSGSNNVASDVSSMVGVFAGPVEQNTTATDISGAGNDIMSTDYVGAFDYTAGGETPASNWASNWTLDVIPGVVAECPAGTTASGDAVPDRSHRGAHL